MQRLTRVLPSLPSYRQPDGVKMVTVESTLGTHIRAVKPVRQSTTESPPKSFLEKVNAVVLRLLELDRAICKQALKLVVGLFMFLICMGLSADALVWGQVGQFYTFVIPLHGLLAAFLIVNSNVVMLYPNDIETGKRNRWRFISAVYIVQFVFLNLYVLGIYGVLGSNDINHEYYANQQLQQQMLDAPFRTDDQVNELKTIRDADGIEDFWNWVKGPLVENMFCEAEDFREDILNGVEPQRVCSVNDGKFSHSGPLVLRTIRTKRRACVPGDHLQLCTSDYELDTEEKQDWGLPIDFTKCSNSNGDPFMTVDHSGITMDQGFLLEAKTVNLSWSEGFYESFNGKIFRPVKSRGLVTNYHSGGYRLYFDTNVSESKDQVRDCVTHLAGSGFIDRFTRAVFVDAMFLMNDIESYHTATLYVEFLTNGATEARITQNHGLLPSNFANNLPFAFPEGPVAKCPEGESDCTPQPFVSPYIHYTLLLNFGFNIFFVVTLIEDLYFDGVKDVVKCGDSIMDAFLYLMLLVSFIFVLLSQRLTPRVFGTENNVVYFLFLEKSFLAIILLFFWVRLGEYMEFAKGTGVIVRTIINASQEIFVFMFIFLVIVLGFTITFYLVFGTISPDFKSLGVAFFSTVRMLTGDIDTDNLLLQIPFLTFFMYTMYIFFVVFTLLTLMIAILGFHFDDAMELYNERKRQLSKADNDDSDESGIQAKLADSETCTQYKIVRDELLDWVCLKEPGLSMKVVVWSASKLSRVSKKSKPNTYVKMAIVNKDHKVISDGMKQSARTQTMYNTTNPIFDFGKSLSVASLDDYVSFVVFENVALSNDIYLGEINIEVGYMLQHQNLYGPQGRKYQLKDMRTDRTEKPKKISGAICVSVRVFEDFI